MNLTVSVIIVNYNVKDYLANCLNSIQNSNYGGHVEIIVIDNSSYDGSVAMVRERFPAVRLIEHNSNMGFANGVNSGLKEATGDFILLLNPDTVIEEKTLSVLTDYMNSHPEVGICGPKILNADGSLQLACKRSFPMPWVALPKLLGLSRLFPKGKWTGRYNLTYLDPGQYHSVEAVSGSFMIMTRDVLETVGELDERFFMFGEDLDYCYRTIQAGYEIHYVPDTQIIHYKGESVKSAPYDSVGWFYEAMDLFVNKHFSKTASLLTRIVLKIGITSRKVSTLLSSSLAQILPVILDVCMVGLAFVIAIPVRFGSLAPAIDAYLPVVATYAIFWVVVGGLFQTYSRFVLAYNRAMLSSILGFLLSVAFTYFFKQIAYSRAVLLGASVLITLFIPGWRLVAHVLKSRGFLRNVMVGNSPIFSRPAVIVGAGDEGIRIARRISRRPDTGIYIVGFADPRPKEVSTLSSWESTTASMVGSTDDLESIVQAQGVRELIFTSDRLDNESIVAMMDSTKHLRLTYKVVPREQDILLGKASVEDVSDFPFVSIEYTLYHRLNVISKRIFDVVFSGIMLVLFSPFFLALLLRYFRWEKKEFWGREGSRFTAWMTPAKNRFFRELPLLLKILSGEMSFVGSAVIPTVGDVIHLICKPGLTGLDRIRKLHLDSDERAIYDHYYVQNQSMAFDVEILIRSVFAL
ncbi:MAG TPA: glycosyltransferase [Candidatus Marinimicrobia bacterium]|nr:glycosyltransferase [Candidatus Neomarinimicrobiota bacterium]HIB96166.1 glycosyltransferase [Candidatus Neomarinimicrobiota bacterium]HIN62263.1 glycosyltransferase [Candidatus Neomarinimicrobiota bacterium]